MGWTGIFNWIEKQNGQIDRKSTVDRELTRGMNDRYEMLKSAMNGTTHYAAFRDNETGDVFAMVTLTSFSDGEFLYKENSENVCPIAYNCPKSILSLLTETNDKYAIEWRQRCYDNLKSKKGLSALPIGARIRFKTSSDREITLIKMQPDYQFKTPWYKIEGDLMDKKIEELTHDWYELTMENIKLRDRNAELEAELRYNDNYPADFFDRDGNLKPDYADETCIEMPVKKARKPRTRKAA